MTGRLVRTANHRATLKLLAKGEPKVMEPRMEPGALHVELSNDTHTYWLELSESVVDRIVETRLQQLETS